MKIFHIISNMRIKFLIFFEILCREHWNLDKIHLLESIFINIQYILIPYVKTFFAIFTTLFTIIYLFNLYSFNLLKLICVFHPIQ